MRNTDITTHGIKEIRIAAVSSDLPNLVKIHIMDIEGRKSKICLFFEDKIDIGLDAELPTEWVGNMTVLGNTEVRGESVHWTLGEKE